MPGHARRGYLSLAVSALVFNLVPVFGTAAAVIGLGEQLRAVEVAGGALIVLNLLVLSRSREPDGREAPALARWAARALRHD